LQTSYTTTQTLTTDEVYKFKVQARNSVGYSLDSSEILVRVARIPDAPANVRTEADSADVVSSRIYFLWDAPYNGGSPLLSYEVLILESDGVTYTPLPSECDGADSTVLSNHYCTVLISTLRAEPFALPWGASITIKVKATNIVGSSDY
jgi:hypothetical protein